MEVKKIVISCKKNNTHFNVFRADEEGKNKPQVKNQRNSKGFLVKKQGG